MPVQSPRWLNRVRLSLELLEARRLLTTYYLSPSGDDGNSGTSQDSPWRSIAQLNRFNNFQPGDAIRFQGGADFPGNLYLAALPSTPGAPITLGSYGNGRATIDADAGSAITILDTQGIEIHDLVLTGSGTDTNNGDGIAFFNDLASTPLDHIVVQNVEAQGFGSQPDPIHGLPASYADGWGVYFAAYTRSSVYSDVTIEASALHDNGNGGLFLMDNPKALGAEARNVLVDHVQAYHNSGVAAIVQGSGFGISLMNVFGALVNRCEAHDNSWMPTSASGASGIGVLSSRNVVVQYSESYGNRGYGTQEDGNGFSTDASQNVLFQYNYSHDNDGTGFLFCSCDSYQYSHRTILRYNISENDARRNLYGAFYLAGFSRDSDIYNNTIYISPPLQRRAYGIVDLRGYGHIRNNIIVTTGGVPALAVEASTPDLILQGNDYFAADGNLVIDWEGTNYHSVADWQADTHQEEMNGQNVGFQTDPMLVNAGGGGTIGNADLLDTLSAYHLQSGSPLLNAGLDLQNLFHVNAGPYDYYGDPVPPYNVGAGGAASVGALTFPVRVSLPGPDPLRGILEPPGGSGAAALSPGVLVIPVSLGAGGGPPANPLNGGAALPTVYWVPASAGSVAGPAFPVLPDPLANADSLGPGDNPPSVLS